MKGVPPFHLYVFILLKTLKDYPKEWFWIFAPSNLHHLIFWNVELCGVVLTRKFFCSIFDAISNKDYTFENFYSSYKYWIMLTYCNNCNCLYYSCPTYFSKFESWGDFCRSFSSEDADVTIWSQTSVYSE